MLLDQRQVAGEERRQRVVANAEPHGVVAALHRLQRVGASGLHQRLGAGEPRWGLLPAIEAVGRDGAGEALLLQELGERARRRHRIAHAEAGRDAEHDGAAARLRAGRREIDAEQASVEARGASPAGPALAWAGVGISVAALGAGIFWSTVDDECIAAGADACGAIRTTKTEAIAAASAGVALSALTGYLWARQRPSERRMLRGGWLWAAGGLSVAIIATGTGLMVIDERAHQLGDGDANVGLRTYRPTLEVGATVTAAGAAALGFSIYSAMGRDDATALLPTVTASDGGAAIGIAGRF